MKSFDSWLSDLADHVASKQPSKASNEEAKSANEIGDLLYVATKNIEDKAGFVSVVLSSGFPWYKTKEGDTFWHGLVKQLHQKSEENNKK